MLHLKKMVNIHISYILMFLLGLWHHRRADSFKKMAGRAVLLAGPPGTGKVRTDKLYFIVNGFRDVLYEVFYGLIIVFLYPADCSSISHGSGIGK